MSRLWDASSTKVPAQERGFDVAHVNLLHCSTIVTPMMSPVQQNPTYKGPLALELANRRSVAEVKHTLRERGAVSVEAVTCERCRFGLRVLVWWTICVSQGARLSLVRAKIG